MVSYQQKITLKGCEASIDHFTDLLKEVKEENGSNTATVLYEAMEHWEVAATLSVYSTAGERSGLCRSFQLPLLCCGDRHSKVNLGLARLKNHPTLRSVLARDNVGRSEFLLEALILVMEKFRDEGRSRGSAREILVTDTGLRCAIDGRGRMSRGDGEPSIIRRNSNKEVKRPDNQLTTNGSSATKGQISMTWRQRLAREQTAPPTSKTGWRARMEEREAIRNKEMEGGRMGEREKREGGVIEERDNLGWRHKIEKRKDTKIEESKHSCWRNNKEFKEGIRVDDKMEERENLRNNKYHWSKHLIPVENDRYKPITTSISNRQTTEKHKTQQNGTYSSSGESSHHTDTSPTRIKRKLSITKEEKKAQESIPKPKKRSTIREDYDLSKVQVPERSQEERKRMVNKLEDYMWVIPPDTRSVPGFQENMTKHERHRKGIDCDEVFPGIILGNGATVKKKDYLKQIGISHVLNAAESRGVNVNKEYFQKDSPGMEYMGLRVEDTPQTQICKHFLAVAEYMDEALLSDGRVFVNCVFGKSRSTTCVAVYLMLKHGWDALKALNHIRQARPVQVNSGFLQQLADLDYKLQWFRKCNNCKIENPPVLDKNSETSEKENSIDNVSESDLKLKTNLVPHGIDNLSDFKLKTHIVPHEILKLEKVVFEIVKESTCLPEKITTKKKISVKGNF